MVSRQEDSRLLLAVGLYCLANITFLVSFADQSYGWIPMINAATVHYAARRASDIALGYIFRVLLEFEGPQRWLYTAGFAAVCLVGLGGVGYV